MIRELNESTKAFEIRSPEEELHAGPGPTYHHQFIGRSEVSTYVD